MPDHYVVNQFPDNNGDHEVHVLSCDHLPNPENRVSLGEFESCAPAVAVAQGIWAQSNGCRWCCPPCHTG